IEQLEKEFSGRVPVLVTNENELFDKIHNVLEPKGIRALHGHVKYFDEQVGSTLEEEIYKKDITQAFFYKRNFFKTQKEYRIITSHPVEGGSMTLNLGDIKECVFNLESFDNLKELTLQTIKKEEVES
ncbi:hypothetical protein V7649_16425, partial [Bacillus toyonensis]